MKARRRRPLLIRTESQELIDKISWNSSSSEDSEDEVKNTKKFKPVFPHSEQDMKLIVMNPRNNGYTLMNNIYSRKKKENTLNDNEKSNYTSAYLTNDLVNDSGEKSPILYQKNIISKSDSPIISQNYVFREVSPVLTDKDIIKKIRKKKKEIVNRYTKIDGSSPDIFLSQKSMIIEQNESPVKNDFSVTNCSQELDSIELISSQDSSSLVIINPSTSESSLRASDLNQVYHNPSPRRKSCKKSGLLSQLHKSLNLQKSRISLWHHDIFCKKVIPANTQHIEGIVNYKWKDFSCTILNCSKGINIQSDLEEIFLISLGCNVHCDSDWSNGQIIKLFPPYKEKFVQFEKKEVKLYYNVFKILIEPTSDT